MREKLKSKDLSSIHEYGKDKIYIGSLCTWGNCAFKFHTNNEDQEFRQVSLYTNQYLKIASVRTEDVIEIQMPFSQFFHYIVKNNLGVINYYSQIAKSINR